ncbi:acid phosphatase [Baekduia soli]|uniref:phospholipase C n=1 Tax=Baekduia soli TaxID=496014 RepID=A0A5B8U4H9_9ACTN|nr:alkaline phosphatase family protein [Baekduia soli]QEC47963.1 acid phosphatase [Baekduia soli]
MGLPIRRRALLAAALAAVIAAAVALATGCGSAGSASAGRGAPLKVAPGAVPASATSHVVVIVMENKEDKDVLGTADAPYVTALARRYAVATRSYGIRHPSLPNYLALTSGSTQGITSDCTDCRGLRGRNLVDQLEEHHISWKAYMEGLPSPCFTGASAGGGSYRIKHDPFMYYASVAGSPARCRKVVPYAQLGRDLRTGRLPAFSFITPNMCDDTHDCGVGVGDRFLAGLVPSVLRALGPHGFLVLTYDEGASDAGCCGAAKGGRIATVVAGPDVRRGFRDATPIDHYGVLGTIERALGLPALGGARDARSGRLTRVFVRAPHIP